jgi:hypothetical protein
MWLLQGQLQSWSEQMRGRVSDSAVCADCEKIARYIAIAVKEGEKLEQFKSTLKLLCDLLDTQEQASVLVPAELRPPICSAATSSTT